MSSFAGGITKHKADITKTHSGVRIRIDTLGAVPVELAVSNVTTGLRALFSKDHEIGDAAFDTHWRIGGDAAFAFALLDEPVRKKLRALQSKCTLNLEKGVFTVDAEGHELVKASSLVNALNEVATALSVSRNVVRKRLEGWAKNHADPEHRARAKRMLDQLIAAKRP